MRPTIRAARPSDIAAVLELWQAAAAAPSRTDDPASVARLLAHDPDALLVAEQDGRLVGVLVATWDGWRGNMYRLAVLPAARRRGVGRALVAEGERRLAARGCRRITALVVDTHPGAAAFWSAVGYVLDPRVRRYVR